MSDEFKWPEGDFYACRDDEERLSFTDPVEAMEDYLDNATGWGPKTTDAEAVELIRKPLTVYAWKRMPVSEADLKRWSERAVEALGEHVSEDGYLDPDEAPDLGAGADLIMLEAVTKILRATEIWGCQVTGKVELTGDQVVTLMREALPDWFGEEARHG